ncbi:fatty acid/sphingolipid desaturase [Thozetella sp. PMI_491]|nr:fatty acid/sphingolipid desaturase [Thozetella sp. PMI_491]
MDRDRILTARAVEEMIAEGRTIVIFEDFILRLDSWLDKHPGGRLAILHMVGKDATDEIKAYHSIATWKPMKAYRIGRKPPGPWANMTPPVRGGVYRKRDEAWPAGDILDSSDTEGERASPDPDTSSSTPPTSDCDSSDSGSDEPAPPEKAVRQRVLGRRDGAAQDASRRHHRSAAEYVDLYVKQEVDRDTASYPSLDPAIQQEIARKYQILHQRVRDEGLYNCPYLEYGKEMARYLSIFAMFLVTLRWGWYITSAVFLGLFWHQIMFTAHDAGHRAITKSFVVDTLIGMFVADFCCGLSIGWWKSSHNVHHLVTNQPEHDPDIQNVPLFATCPSFFRSLRSSYYDFTFVWDRVADFMVPYQRYTYYPVMGIARFNLYLLSWLHVLSTRSSSLGSSKAWWIRPTEIAFMSCYWFLFGYCLLWRTLPTWSCRVAFILVCHIATMPIHVQITLSHWGMSVSDLGESESFPQRQLRTTMDVDCPAWLDFIHGGLQFQAIHHLFPRVPRHNLRKAQGLVKEFCRDTGIPYLVLGFMDGNQKVLSRLEEVSNQVRIMVDCQKYMAETGESGLH